MASCAEPNPPQLLASLHQLAKGNCTEHPISYLDTLINMGSESIDAIMRRRWILFAVFVARREDTRLSKCVMFGELMRGAGCAGSQKYIWIGCLSPGRPQSFRYQRRPADDISRGRGEMTQDGGTRGGTFHGEMDSCRESQGWTTTCSSMPERDGKNQGEDSPKQADSCWFARHS